MEGLSEREKALIEGAKKVIEVPTTSWVMFSEGTLVFFYASRMKPEDDLPAMAKSIMERYGPVVVGTSAGDFCVIPFDYAWEPLKLGWGVNYETHHRDILTIILVDDLVEGHKSEEEKKAEEVPTPGDRTPAPRPAGLDNTFIGMYGRMKRDKDSQSLRIIHVEDKRPLLNASSASS